VGGLIPGMRKRTPLLLRRFEHLPLGTYEQPMRRDEVKLVGLGGGGEVLDCNIVFSIRRRWVIILRAAPASAT
jgi:hypothetical protein